MKKPYQNTTDHIQHIGSVTVMPGQMREIEETHIQAHTGVVASAKPEAAAEDPHALFLSANVKTIKENIAGLSADELDAIEKLEGLAENPRKGVMKAIVEARLVLASSGPSEIEQFIASFDGLSDEELSEYVELYTSDDENIAYLDAVNTEIEKRSQAANEND